MNLNFTRLYSHPMILMVSLCAMLSACNKPILPEDVKADIKQQQKASLVVPDLDAICHNLKKEMGAMSAQRTTFALEEINRDIRLCLPIISVEEQKHLMKMADQMYTNFLTVDRTPEQQRAFDQYAFDQSPFPTIHQSHIEQLHTRDQYLLRHKGQAYIELSDLGAGKTAYTRNSQYLAKVFAPYFPEAEKAFMIELGQQNQTATFNKNTLMISPQETLKRALFWESYLKKYPQSPLKKDAEYLLNAYSYFFFIGLADSPVSINFEGAIDIQPSTLSEIEQLATHKNSPLAEQARRFLKFIDLSTDQRHKLVSSNTENTTPQVQLIQYLKLKPIDLNQVQSRNCFSDAICRSN